MSIRQSLRMSSSLAACAAGASAIGLAAAFAAEPVKADEIIVTASPLERTVAETIIGTSVLSGEELARRLSNTIGETLRREPGISSTYFGPGASRPIIRGLGGDRIRVLDAGIGSIDASATSPDHAVAVDTATTERIEIVRGPATLLYGSSAAGGVVNVFNGRIPTRTPEDGLDGFVRVGGSTVDKGFDIAGAFDVKLGTIGGADLVFHGDGGYRDGQDYRIRGFAESDRLRAEEIAEGVDVGDEPENRVDNSAFSTKGGAAGLSLVFANGFFGVSATGMDTLYGVPGGHEHEDEEEEEEISIDLKQRRLDFNGEVSADFLFFQKAKFRLGYADYEHVELEGDEIGTTFTNSGWEGRLELIDQTRNLGSATLNGAVGFQFRTSSFSAIGDEAFVPPADTNQFGVFAVKELAAGPWRFELGGRFETTRHEVVETGDRREFDSFSVAGGIGLKPSDAWFFGVHGFRTERAPSIEELFSDGPHLATRSFEIGDPDLSEEIGRGVEATARFTTERFRFGVNGFYTSYRGFIFEEATGDEEDDLPVFAFGQEDATFRGFEVETEADLFKVGGVDIHADASLSVVRARTAAGDPLPRIPPLSGLFGIEARSGIATLRGELDYAAEQSRIGDFELPTQSYRLYNTLLTLRPFNGAPGVAVRVAGMNLTNERARVHSSFLKDTVPLPGRNVRVSIESRF